MATPTATIEKTQAGMVSKTETSQPWLSRKKLFQVHGWLGMTFGTLLFVICLSGAAAALSREIDWLLNPAIRAMPTGAPQLSWSQWAESAQKAQPDWHIRWIEKPFNPYAAVEVVLDAPSGLWRRIYIHPETGAVQGYSSYFNVQRFLRDFHRLLNIFSFGLNLVSFCGLILLFSLISGLIFYKNWWRNLFQLRFHKGLHAFSSDLHRFLGTWTFLFSILIAATGFWYFYEYTSFRLNPDSQPKPLSLSKQQLAAHGPHAKYANPDQIITATKQAFPDLNILSVHYPLSNAAPIVVYGQASAWIVRDRANNVKLDPYSAQVLEVQRAERSALADRLADSIDPLHFGDFGGLPTKLLWSILGMALPFMILTGSYLSLRKVNSDPKWFRINKWTLATWMNLVIFVYALYCCIPAATRYKTPAIPVFATQTQTQIGPWQAKIEAAAHTIRADFGDANFKSAQVSLGNDAQPLKPRALAFVSTPMKLPTNFDGKLRLSVEDWNGAKHLAIIPFPEAAFHNMATFVPDEGAYTGYGVWYFLAPFLFILSAIFFLWTFRLGHWRL